MTEDCTNALHAEIRQFRGPALVGEPFRIPHRRVHRDGDRQRADGDQVIHHCRDSIDADIAIEPLSP